MALRLPRRPTYTGLTLATLSPQTTTSANPTATTLLSTPCRNHPQQQTQTRNATLIRRPRRPYTFTQLVQLSDGSTYTQRTTSPLALYKSTKDTRNHVLWNPSEKALKNVEVDEAGKLAAFRGRFGRGWDAPSGGEDAESEGGVGGAEGTETKDSGVKKAKTDEGYDPLGDLISQYAAPEKEKAPKEKWWEQGKK